MRSRQFGVQLVSMHMNNAAGVAIAREICARVKGMVQGVQVSAPFGRVEVALEVFGD